MVEGVHPIRYKRHTRYTVMVRGSNNFQLAVAIQNLSPELRKKIHKEYIAIKLKERGSLSWKEVLYAI